MNASAWRVTAIAAGLTALVAGSRASMGLFLSPLNTASGLGMASIGLAAAMGQLAAGAALPAVGVLARRHGTARVIATGAGVLAASTAALGFVNGILAFVALMVVIWAAGTAVASSALLLGEVSRRAPESERGLANGIVGAGGPAGQLLMAPVIAMLMSLQGWVVALCGTAALALLALPLSRSLAQQGARALSVSLPEPTSRRSPALRDARFWLIAASFGICGFHVAFLGVHMPDVIERCGLSMSFSGSWLAVAGAANMAGSIGAGMLMRRCPSATLLLAIYALRALSIALFLVLPPSSAVLLGFAVSMGATSMAAMPPIADLLSRSFGVERLAKLFGVVMLIHQVGGFAGTWLGGVVVERTGGYGLLWIIDIALALVAAGLQWLLMPRPLAAQGSHPVRAALRAGLTG